MTAARMPEQHPNPLYDEWCRLVTGDEGMPGWMRYRDEDRGDFSGHSRRRELCTEYAFAIPSPAVIRHLVGYSPLIEVGAGTGYWAAQLASVGADVIATDSHPPGTAGQTWKFVERYFDVEAADGPAAAAAHADRTLLLCWPPMDDVAARTLQAYTDAGGQRVVYIGEVGGCTANEEFHDQLWLSWRSYDEDEVPPDVLWHEVRTYDVPQWPGMHDRVHVCERR